LQTLCFLFFFHRTFLKTILASRTNGTFGFAPAAQADTQAKPKEPLFPTLNFLTLQNKI